MAAGSVASAASAGSSISKGSVISIVRETQGLRRKKNHGTQEDEQAALYRGRQSGAQTTVADDNSEEDDGKLAYLDMKNSYYYGATLGFFAVILLGACVIPDVDVIFEFAGAICVNNLSFIFPGLFYIAANKRYAMNRDRGALLESFA